MDEPRTSHEPFAEATRVTPYELVFGEAGLAERLFPAIEAEAGRSGLDSGRLDMFMLLPAATRALHDLVPPDAPAEALEQHRIILFQVFNFWRFGKRFYLLESAVARYLVEAAPSSIDGPVPLPARSLYVQLPANLFWASIAPEIPPEPVDGFFVTAFDGSDSLDGVFRHLHVLMVLGIRRHRAGFSVIPFETETGAGIPAEWASAEGRDDGNDFDSVLPGGEMAGIYSIVTTAEALKLVTRALVYLDTAPEAIAYEQPLERRDRDRPNSVRYSRLPCHRVRLGEAGGEPGRSGDGSADAGRP